ncbi:MAG: type II toxin-antitoxin system Phd/YefM family antitoxin [Solirubrobacterales bacterium]
MRTQFNMHEAKTQLSRLAERAASGEEIVIARDGHPLAKLVPIPDRPEPRRLGLLRGRIRIAGDFDAPLPAEVQSEFESGTG